MNNLFNLPNIENNLSDIESKRRLKYLNIYIRLIKRCQIMKDDELSGYNEVHHILPKCLGGDDVETNLVKMPVRYHIMAHMLLFEIYPENIKIAYALKLMITTGMKGNPGTYRDSILNEKFSSRTIAIYKEESRKSLSKKPRKPHSEETKRKLSKQKLGEKNPQFGTHKSFEEKLNLSLKFRGSGNPNYSKEQSEEAKEKMRLNHKNSSGSNNGKAKKVKSPEGKIYLSASEAAEHEGIPYKRLTHWLEGIRSNPGWFYIDNDGNISKSTPKRKKIINSDGKIFNSIKEAREYYKISNSTIYKWINGYNGRIFNPYGLKFYED